MFSPGISAAVTTTTFDQSKPGSRSRASKVAWASVERIVAPYHAPGTTMSSVYSAVPVSLAGPSRRKGAAGRALPGTTVAGSTITASAGSVPVVMLAVWEPSMAHDDTTRRGGSTGPRWTAPDRSGPSSRGARSHRQPGSNGPSDGHIGHLCTYHRRLSARTLHSYGVSNHGSHAGDPAAGPGGRDRREHGDPGPHGRGRPPQSTP